MQAKMSLEKQTAKSILPQSKHSVYIEEQIRSHGLALLVKDGDEFILGWTCDSLNHPRNWSFRRKAYNASLIISLDFVAYVIGRTLFHLQLLTDTAIVACYLRSAYA